MFPAIVFLFLFSLSPFLFFFSFLHFLESHLARFRTRLLRDNVGLLSESINANLTSDFQRAIDDEITRLSSIPDSVSKSLS